VGEPDLAVDAQLGDHVGDGERRAHLERLGTREPPVLNRFLTARSISR